MGTVGGKHRPSEKTVISNQRENEPARYSLFRLFQYLLFMGRRTKKSTPKVNRYSLIPNGGFFLKKRLPRYEPDAVTAFPELIERS